MRKAFLLVLVLCFSLPLMAQSHTYPATDTDNHFTGSNTFETLNNIQVVTPNSPGTDLCAKIALKVLALVATNGGTVDARALSGNQTCTSDPFAGVSVPVALKIGVSTVTSTATWNPSTGSLIEGICGSNPEGNSIAESGTILKWAGTTSTAMIHYAGTSGTMMRCLTLDGQNIAGSIGILTDATGGASHGSKSIFERFSVRNAEQGMTCGNPSSVPDVNNFAFDMQEVRNFFITGGTSLTAEGIHINSNNCFDAGLIANGAFLQLNKGIAIYNGGGPYFAIERVVTGNGQGLIPTFIYLGPGNTFTPDIINTHSEGTSLAANATGTGLSFAVHDSTCGVTMPGAPYARSATWRGNAWQQPVLIDGCDYVVSLGNSGHGKNPTTGGFWNVGASAAVLSIWDTLYVNPVTPQDTRHYPWRSVFGIDTTVNSGATRTGNVATVKLTSNSSLAVGTYETVSGVSDSSFNGTFQITAITVGDVSGSGFTTPTIAISYANPGPDVGAATAGGGLVTGGILQGIGQDGFLTVPKYAGQNYTLQMDDLSTAFHLNFSQSTGTIDWNFEDDSSQQFQCLEGSSNSYIRCLMKPNGNSEWNASGAGITRFNVRLGTGTGGSQFGDGAGNITSSISATGKGTFNGGTVLGTTVVGSLPAAGSNSFMQIGVTDSTAIVAEGQTCVGGGSVKAVAISNGTIWKCF